jgi:hypothetical protein
MLFGMFPDQKKFQLGAWWMTGPFTPKRMVTELIVPLNLGMEPEIVMFRRTVTLGAGCAIQIEIDFMSFLVLLM